jgi:protein involved in polysaccharide export with SLBB domain
MSPNGIPQEQMQGSEANPCLPPPTSSNGNGIPQQQAQNQEMSSEQIIAVLQQQPQLLTQIRNIAAQKLGVDPGSISDDAIYDRIRQDPGLQAQASAQLTRLGYNTAGSSGYNPGLSSGCNPQMPGKGNWYQNFPGNAQYQYQRSQPEQLNQIPLREQSMPYRNLPSLEDLYAQVLPESLKLRRFGSDTFLLGTGNVNQLPMDLPVGPDYVLGPGDNLILNMWGSQSARLDRTIDRQGEIALPEAGTISVTGLTIAQAQSAIGRALNTQFQNEHVELSLGRVRTVRVYVVGDVQRPGAYDVSSLSTVLNALYEAGGPTSRGSLRTVRLYRGKTLVREVDLYDFLLRGVRSDLSRLQPGDTILVPPVGAQVAVTGMVRRPAIYELRGKETLQDVLNMAGGTLVTGSLKQIRVIRVVAHQRQTMISTELASSGSMAKPPPFLVQDGDEVVVSPILPYNDRAVYLEGHVYRPGRYPWHEGITVSDLIHSYQDLMPEPATRAEIVRLMPPDFRPEAISFNLPDELVGNISVPLEPFDVVRIFGRYDADAPIVSIYGEVLHPGKYPMSQGMTVADLVRMAGGFRRGAYRALGDLSTYTIENGQKVLLQHSVVEVQKAMEGDKSADVTLKAGDVVGIRQISGWQDIGSSITVSGEVGYSGTYGISDGERLSSVLRRAGGFRIDAFPQGAVLERVQVRELQDQSRQAMIQRLEATTPSVKSGIAAAQDQMNLLQEMRQEQQEVLASLRSHTPNGRLVIRISSDIGKWANTPADIVLRAGDRLVIPKRPDFVLVSGQVYNPTAISYVPGRDARWYLSQAGGATRSGEKKDIYIVRANGSVVGHVSGWGSVWSRNSVLDIRMERGDSIVVPEKIIGGSLLWKNLIGTASIMSSVALTGAATGIF